MGNDWIEYECKSGQTLFVYNKETGEHRWAHDLGKGVYGTIMYGRSVTYKEYRNVAIQTDDNGCNNGCECMSMFIRSVDCALSRQPGVSDDDKNLNRELGAFGDDGGCVDNNSGDGDDDVDDRGGVHDDGVGRTPGDDDCGGVGVSVDVVVSGGGNSDVNNQNVVINAVGYNKSNSVGDGDYNDYAVSDVFCRTDAINDSSVCSNDDNGDGVGGDDDDDYGRVDHNDNGGVNVDDKGSNDVDDNGSNDVDDSASNDDDDEDYVCNFNRQETVHSKLKPFECFQCKRTFTQNKNLQRHYRAVHMKLKPFPCLVCGKKFGIKENFLRHKKTIHMRLRPFECLVCGKTFGEKDKLSRHTRVHTGEKPYECSVCKKKFTFKKNLNLHFRIHTGERPYGCSYCTRKLRTWSSMTRHVATHANWPFECSVCNKRFKRENYFQKHLKTH